VSTPATTVSERDGSHYIGLSVAYLRKARRQGRGPAYLRIGRTIRYRIADLDAWLDAHRVVTRESRAS
jgi:predicted DNA-binding transcriptional regulator AlpA